MPTTSTNLFSLETVNTLVVDPTFRLSVALSSGLTRINTSATRYYLPVVAGGSASWPAAELTELTDAGVTAAELEITPKRLATLQVVSNQAVEDADASAMLGRALVSALADEVDRAFFAGAGPSGPLGLPGVVGVETVDAVPSAGLDAFVDAAAAVEENGGQVGAIYVSPTTWAALSKIKTQSGSNAPVLSPQAGPTQQTTRSLFGIPVYTSRHIGNAAAWVVDISRLAVVVRNDARVDVDKSARFTADGTAVRATLRLDFAAPYPQTIAKVSLSE